jgi:alanine-glyoxylate transaminase/serine-glyoxylate transaminase/serine-pyruvate transaminase
MAGRFSLFPGRRTCRPDTARDARPMDHRSAVFPNDPQLHRGLKPIFKTTSGTPILFPSSGTGCWEAALTGCLDRGARS